MKIEEQIDAFIHEYGWTGDGDFAAKAVHFVDTVVGATRLRLPKNPFGDLTTSLGMKDVRALQLLVDVQGKTKVRNLFWTMTKFGCGHCRYN